MATWEAGEKKEDSRGVEGEACMAREAEEGVAVSTIFRSNDGRCWAIWHPSHEALDII